VLQLLHCTHRQGHLALTVLLQLVVHLTLAARVLLAYSHSRPSWAACGSLGLQQ
jgi:hypothetical protein